MNKLSSRHLLSATAVAALLALGACGDRVADTSTSTTTTATPPVAATTETRQETVEARQDGVAGTSGAGTAVMGAPSAVGSGVSTMGDKVDDGQITAKVNAGLASDSNLSAIRIDVDTKDGVVTLKGPVPNEAAKERAAEIAKGVSEVKSVDNQLTVKAS